MLIEPQFSRKSSNIFQPFSGRGWRRWGWWDGRNDQWISYSSLQHSFKTLCPELGYSQIWWLIIIFVPRKKHHAMYYWYVYIYNICIGHDFQRTPSRAQLLQLHIGLLVEWFSPNLLTKPRFQSGRPSPEHWLSFGSHFFGPMKRVHDCGGGIV